MCRESGLDRAVIYARVSVSHKDNKDMTIDNQISIAKDYIEKNGLVLTKVFTDKGYSGRNFNRPGWKGLIKAAYEKDFKCIVVKDLSRIGRNYIETGEYIENCFMKQGIRVIAVSDMYDSFSSAGDSLSFGIKNVINEWYARESGRKVSAVKQYKKENGEFVGSIAPYGYKISVVDGKRVLVKNITMYIVDMMIYMKNNGHTSVEIADFLSKCYVNTPSEYNRTGKIYCNDRSMYKKWDSGSVRKQFKHHRG